MGMVEVLGIEPRYDEPSYLWPRPRLRGVSHAVAAVVTLPAGLALLAAADGGRARIAAGIYVLFQLAVFTTSAIYHRVATEPEFRRRMQIADHCMIYLLIAGTWTPVCLLVLPAAEGRVLQALVIATATIGISLKLFGVDRFPQSANAMYGVLGWAGLLAVPGLLAHGPGAAITALALGGLAYSVGAVILMLKTPDPIPDVFGYHEVWHLCTIAGAVFHFAATWIIAT